MVDTVMVAVGKLASQAPWLHSLLQSVWGYPVGVAQVMCLRSGCHGGQESAFSFVPSMVGSRVLTNAPKLERNLGVGKALNDQSSLQGEA